ncbi:DegT/DnrJ/EryC1/StrS aminotransferase family protein [Thalassospira profundimaris]|uniref:Aminotransferase n=1 Tax=Thalassospira profundimaris TaxID=502049 RepID=A0A367WHP7_9PROT|nr:DegT/DnrJ/EryC1/StrS family aminotransferase [Thalassospira profundimaris]RCK40976.1 hypothetical protein TH30_22415 [Thalassospira profundimaris]
MTENNVYVTRPFISDPDLISQKIAEVLKSGQLTNNGPKVVEFENALASKLDVEHLSVFTNGTLALMIALKALDLTGEVITTPFTFAATVHALQWLGLTPVFCDIDPESMCIDPTKIEQLITPRTSAILGVHVFGFPCDVEAIENIAERHGVKVVYDGAHSLLTQFKGRSLSHYGDITMHSFHATKLLNSLEGGALIFKSAEMKEKSFLLNNFGIRGEENIFLPGLNAKMNEVQALVGIENLKQLHSEIEKRDIVYRKYSELLGNVDGIRIPQQPACSSHSYQYFPIIVADGRRDVIHSALKEAGIHARKYFYPLLSNIETYSNLPSARRELLKVANDISDSVLCLPYFGELDEETVVKICNVIKNA